MEKISIIIPVYNAEAFLRECVESAVSQTYPNIEIVLVDDGSNDASPKICDEYAHKHHSVKVIHKINAGESEARKTGVETASGDVLYFLDSDDSIEKDTISSMMEYMKSDVDIVAFETKDDHIYSPSEWIGSVLQRKANWNQWGKLYRRHLFDDWVQSFPRLKVGADFVLNVRLAKKLKGKVIYVPKSKYNYRVISSSAMSCYKHDLDYELKVVSIVKDSVSELSFDLEEPLFYYEVNMLSGLIAHGLKVDYNSTWVSSVVERSRKYNLSTRQRFAVKSVSSLSPRLILRSEKIAKTIVKRLMLRKGAR